MAPYERRIRPPGRLPSFGDWEPSATCWRCKKRTGLQWRLGAAGTWILYDGDKPHKCATTGSE